MTRTSSPPAAVISRRAALQGLAAIPILTAAGGAEARGRAPVGGRVTLRVPWSLAAVDPHRLDDGAAAVLGEALFDALYARDAAGAFVPALAEAEPEAASAKLKVTLRAGLTTARGHALDAKDVASSIARARSLGARAWLVDVPVPRVEASHTLVFAMRDPAKLVRALASPLVAIVPRQFSPQSPDGTGPFRAERRGDGLVLERNPNAASGPALLEEILLRPSVDLGDSLRAFEGGADDIGWLGLGLRGPRPNARTFDAGMIGWALLFTGRDAGPFDAPGVAQRLCDELPPQRLAYLALGAPWPVEPAQGWGGAACSILVREDSPWLVELARSVAAILSRPSREVGVHPVPAPELAQRRASRSFALAVDLARPLARGTLGALAALASADNPGGAEDVVRRPPRLGDVPARTLTRALRVGVLGEVRAQGGRTPDLALVPSVSGFGLDWGAATRASAKA